MIRKIKAIKGLTKRAAPKCAEALDSAINSELAKGHGPSGEAWPPTLEGKEALPNASGNAVTTKAVGTTLVVAPKAPYVFHDRGAYGVTRKVIPTSLTANLAAPIRQALEDEYNKTMGK